MIMDDPLGARSDCVDLGELTRWNLTQLPMTSEEDEDAEISPFPWRNDLNAKLILWYMCFIIINLAFKQLILRFGLIELVILILNSVFVFCHKNLDWLLNLYFCLAC